MSMEGYCSSPAVDGMRYFFTNTKLHRLYGAVRRWSRWIAECASVESTHDEKSCTSDKDAVMYVLHNSTPRALARVGRGSGDVWHSYSLMEH